MTSKCDERELRGRRRLLGLLQQPGGHADLRRDRDLLLVQRHGLVRGHRVDGVRQVEAVTLECGHLRLNPLLFRRYRVGDRGLDERADLFGGRADGLGRSSVHRCGIGRRRVDRGRTVCGNADGPSILPPVAGRSSETKVVTAASEKARLKAMVSRSRY